MFISWYLFLSIFTKISDVVDNDVVKNTVYNELVNAIHNMMLVI